MFDEGILGVVSLVINYGPYGPSLGLGILLWGVISFLCLRILWGDESPIDSERSQKLWSVFILVTLPFFSFGAILFLLIYKGEANLKLALMSIVLVIIFPVLFLCEAHVYDRQLKGKEPDPMALYVANLNIPMVFLPPKTEEKKVHEKLNDDVYMKVTFDEETNTIHTQTNNEAVRQLMEVKRNRDGTTDVLNFEAFRFGTTFDDVVLPPELMARPMTKAALYYMKQKIDALPAAPDISGTAEELRHRMDIYYRDLRYKDRRGQEGIDRLSLQFFDYILEDGVINKKEFDAITAVYHAREESQSQRMAPIARFFTK